MPTFNRELLVKIFTEKYVDACLPEFYLPEGYLEKINEWGKSAKGILFFAGNPGLGKTYFCAAYANYVNEKNKDFRYFQCNNFLSLIRQQIALGWDYIAYIKYIAEEVFLFCLDDIGENKDTEWQREVIAYLVDLRYKSNLPTILTSNLFLKDIGSMLGERTVSRIREVGNLILEIDWLDKRQNPLHNHKKNET